MQPNSPVWVALGLAAVACMAPSREAPKARSASTSVDRPGQASITSTSAGAPTSSRWVFHLGKEALRSGQESVPLGDLERLKQVLWDHRGQDPVIEIDPGVEAAALSATLRAAGR